MKPSPLFWLALLVAGLGVRAGAQITYTTPYVFTTLAGKLPGYFNLPQGVAVDGAGNVYVADTVGGTIRKITPAGVVNTLAGGGNGIITFGSADGIGSKALFYFPGGVAVDTAGNVYVADSGNNTIRKITADDVVGTLAGLAGTSGSTDGTGSAAQFNDPGGVAVDTAGNVYVTDSGNNTIRKITPAGVVSTLAGLAGTSGSADGTGSEARFSGPYGVTVDTAGNVYVTDSGNNTIRKITPAGVVSTLAGLAGTSGSADGTGSAAQFNDPIGVAVDTAGNVYVTDSGNNTIRKITSAGVVSTLAGLAGTSGSADGTGSAAQFSYLNGVTVDSAGNVYVADSYPNRTIRKITPAGVVSTLAGVVNTMAWPPSNSGSADGTGNAARFLAPTGVAVDVADNVYVADSANATIRKITPAGAVSTLAGLAGNPGSADGTGSDARFNFPDGVAVDAAGNVYVADFGNQTIRKITPAGVVSTLAGLAGNPGSADGTGSEARFNFKGPQFSSGDGIAVDAAGNVYVADYNNNTIRKITPAGVVSTLAGLAGTSGSADGTGSEAQFSGPSGIGVDGAGNVYVTDSGNNTIRKITPAGAVSTLAGLAGSFGYADGTGSEALFMVPTGGAVDATGNFYVTDSYTHMIRKITADGVVSTLAGTSGSAVRFNLGGVAVDTAGNVYVTDSINNIIFKGASVSTPFALWQVSHFSSTIAPYASPTDDPDRDGLPNLLEYAFNTDPLVPSSAALPVSSITTAADDLPHLTLTVSLNASASDITVSAEVSSDLLTWNSGATYTETVSDTTVGNVRTLVVRDMTPLSAGAHRFMRLKVLLNATAAPGIITQPQSQTVTAGQNATFTVAASGTPAPGYQWQVSLDGGSTWGNLSDNGTYGGSATTTLTVSGTTAAMSGELFQCVASNGVSPNTTSNAATLTVNAAPFAQWQVSHFGSTTATNASPTDDPDHDGLSNLLEYAFNTDPLSANASPVTVSVASNHLTITVAKNPAATDATFTAEVSSDLATWSSAGVTVLQDTNTTFQAQDNTTLDATSRRFIRVRVTVP